VVQIGDFGSATEVIDNPVNPYTREVSTRWYKAPELLYGAYLYNESVDLWSFGCIIAECLKGEPLFPGLCDVNQLCHIFDALGTIDLEEWHDARNLPDYGKIHFQPRDARGLLIPTEHLPFIEEVVRLHPGKRRRANQLLSHEWIAEPVLRNISIPIRKHQPALKASIDFSHLEDDVLSELSEIIETPTPPLTDLMDE